VKLTKYLAYSTMFLAVLFAANFSSANVWMDESFDDNVAFGPSSDGSATAEDGLDLYSYNALSNPLSITHTGAISSARAFNGTQSYVLTAGQGVAVNLPYQDPQNGAFQYLQFAASVGSIPASGTMAQLIWDFELNSIDHRFFVAFVSNGSSVDLVAGESKATTAPNTIIGNIPDTNTWRYITLQVSKNIAGATDPGENTSDPGRFAVEFVPQGCRFYVNSDTAGLAVPAAGTVQGPADPAGAWIVDVTSGSLYLDSIYWEGGMDFNSSTPAGADNPRDRVSGTPFDLLSVDDWQLY